MRNPKVKPTLTWMGSELQERLLGSPEFSLSLSVNYINLLIVAGYRQVAEAELKWLKEQGVRQAFCSIKFEGLENLATTDTKDMINMVGKLSLWVPEYILAHPQECKGLAIAPYDIQDPRTRSF